MPSGAQNLQMGSHLRVKASVLTNGLAVFTTCPFLYPSSPWPQILLLCALCSPLQPHGPSSYTLGTVPSRASALVSLSATRFPGRPTPWSSASSAWVFSQMSSSQEGLPSPPCVRLQPPPLSQNSFLLPCFVSVSHITTWHVIYLLCVSFRRLETPRGKGS